MKALLAGLLILALAMVRPAALAAAGPATRAELKQKLKDAQQEKQQVRQQLRAQERQLQSAVKQERSVKAQLDAANRELESARRETLTNVRNLGLVEDNLQRIRNRLSQLSGEEEQDRAGLRRSLVSLYKARQRNGPALLFSAQSPAELAGRARYLGALSSASERRIRGLRERIGQIQDYHQQQSAKQEEFLRSRESAEASRLNAERKRQQKLGQLREVARTKQSRAEAVRELQRREGSLQGLMGDLVKDIARAAAEQAAQARRQPHKGHGATGVPSAVGGASSLRRGLLWPVRGRLVSRYGKQMHPVFKTPVFNRGIEIAAPFGASVSAVASGRVLHAAPMEGFGELVVLDHGGGMMSVYGYGSKVLVHVGDGVAAGDTLAEVGEPDTGREPSLYFEIRQGAKALDPFTYLRRR